MKPVFANSAFVDAAGWMIEKGGSRQKIPLKVRYGICDHPTAGLTLIDTGYGPRVTEGQRSAALRLYSRVLGLRLVKDGQPEGVLRQMGADARDVRAIVVTHFHADHIAALDLFPSAKIYTKRRLFESISSRSNWQNLRHGVFPELLPASCSGRIVDIDHFKRAPAPHGLGSGADLFGDGTLLAVDLPGHAEGHFGVCFARLPKPLLYAVDVQWVTSALPADRHPGFPAKLVAHDRAAAISSAALVAAFQENGGDILLCHDPKDSPYDLPVDRP